MLLLLPLLLWGGLSCCALECSCTGLRIARYARCRLCVSPCSAAWFQWQGCHPPSRHTEQRCVSSGPCMGRAMGWAVSGLWALTAKQGQPAQHDRPSSRPQLAADSSEAELTYVASRAVYAACIGWLARQSLLCLFTPLRCTIASH